MNLLLAKMEKKKIHLMDIDVVLSLGMKKCNFHLDSKKYYYFHLMTSMHTP